MNCSTIEQSLGQLVAAINTLKDVFIKKIQQESQQQIDKLDNLEQDYRRLQLDINALRTQLASQDSSDPIQQYTVGLSTSAEEVPSSTCAQAGAMFLVLSGCSI